MGTEGRRRYVNKEKEIINTGKGSIFSFSEAAEVEVIWGMDLFDGLWLKRLEGVGKWELDIMSSQVSSSGGTLQSSRHPWTWP